MASTLWNISDGAWSAIAAWVGLLLVLAGAVVAFFQLKDARKLRAEQAQPYVVIYAEPLPSRPNFVDLVVKNFGATAARDIRFTIIPEPIKSASGDSQEVKLPDVIRSLVPGQEWRTFWDTTFNRKDLGLPDHYEATIEFRDSRGKPLAPYKVDLDWGQILGRGWIQTYGMHELSEAVRETRDVLKGWKGDGNTLRVLAYDGDMHDQEAREKYEQRLREQAELNKAGEQPSGEDA